MLLLHTLDIVMVRRQPTSLEGCHHNLVNERWEQQKREKHTNPRIDNGIGKVVKKRETREMMETNLWFQFQNKEKEVSSNLQRKPYLRKKPSFTIQYYASPSFASPTCCLSISLPLLPLFFSTNNIYNTISSLQDAFFFSQQ